MRIKIEQFAILDGISFYITYFFNLGPITQLVRVYA